MVDVKSEVKSMMGNGFIEKFRLERRNNIYKFLCYLPAETKSKLARVCQDKGVSRSEFVRQAVEYCLTAVLAKK